jgi:peptidoglycan/xylan/chitin deacetylase (PgdA/CDA1 family)
MSLVSRAKFPALTIANSAGFNWVLRKTLGGRLLVLCYHGVVAADHPDEYFLYRNTVSAAQFDRQLAMVKKWFRPVAASDVARWVHGKGDLPERAVLITFDDGYRNNLTLAAPILLKHGVPALISVTTGYIGTGRMLWTDELNRRILHSAAKTIPLPGGETRPAGQGREERIELAESVRRKAKRLSDEDRRAYLEALRALPVEEPFGGGELYEFLSWNDVRKLHSLGFEIGSHTAEHPILSRVAPQELARELCSSKAAIERESGAECSTIVYPNGGTADVSDAVIEAAEAAGYRLGFLLTAGINRGGEHFLRLTRINIPGHLPDSLFAAQVSGLYTVLRATGR